MLLILPATVFISGGECEEAGLISRATVLHRSTLYYTLRSPRRTSYILWLISR